MKVGNTLNSYAELCDFQNLYRAHLAARRGKRGKTEVIRFEMNLAENLCFLQKQLETRQYYPKQYYQFMVHDPKERVIHATHYPDRVVQHCLCDNIVRPVMDRRLIFDNAACRKGKGTHFAIYRLSGFLREHWRQSGTRGYFLKCDVRKYFENIDHEVLRGLLAKMPFDEHATELLHCIIDSYQGTPGKGLPLGNQTSQWFALTYLDPVDRLIKEKLKIRHYTRYMDDLVLVHESKAYLRECLSAIKELAEGRQGLCFNEKTQIFPIKNGVNYLGFHFYLTDSGKVVRKVRPEAKKRFRKALQKMEEGYAAGIFSEQEISQRVSSYMGHLKHGHTYRLREKLLRSEYVLQAMRSGK